MAPEIFWSRFASLDSYFRLDRIGCRWCAANTRRGPGPDRPGTIRRSAPPATPPPTAPANWSIHFQNTDIVQGVPGFDSPYRGDNSLTADQTRETVTATAFLARRLWEGATIAINPEYAQGQGLDGTHGVAGFPNGEATKAGSLPGQVRHGAPVSQSGHRFRWGPRGRA